METESSASPSGQGGLSSGAIAGIAIGVAAFVAVLALGAFLLYRKRKKSQQQTSAATSIPDRATSEQKDYPHYHPQSTYQGQYQRQELDARNYDGMTWELPADGSVQQQK